MSSASGGQRMVVLAGWLGCKRHHLKPYESLYEELGFDVFVAIASPRAVVEATHMILEVKLPNDWPRKWRLPSKPSVLDYAWNILATIYEKEPDMIGFHSFSNGGAFLWEQVLRIIHAAAGRGDPSTDFDPYTRSVLLKMASRFRFLVFDSCPAWFAANPSALRMALAYCSKEEREEILEEFGAGVVLHDGAKEFRLRQKRCQAYFSLLSESDILLASELYIYCRNDPICDTDYVDTLVRERRLRMAANKNHIKALCFRKSKHCMHLKIHPTEYRSAIRDIIRLYGECQSRL